MRLKLFIQSSFIFLISLQASTADFSDSISWKMVPEQKVDQQYHRDFAYRHDKGLFFLASLGPQWNQSIQNPKAGSIRFGGRLALGAVPIHNLAFHGTIWGNFLEEATLLAVGPGLTFFIGDSNFALGVELGIGQIFNSSLSEDQAFRETVLAIEGNAGKYWWLSRNTSLGLALTTGLHGFTLSQATFSSVGWHTGLRLEFIFN